ncbi:aminopeptidase [Clostridium sp. KNHs214]|uniref:aminopeptidase n=1 Tax=Clostridium sp. KNHs214 TaxID=1540257 RepID=UPI000AADF5BF|nr:aminopeptidase [Clostridium sp. KNHs214]
MLDVMEFYKEENEKVLDSYKKGLLDIENMCTSTEKYQEDKEPKEYYRFLNHTGRFLLKIAKFEENLNDGYFETKNFQELKEENNGLYTELLEENYKTSYANPTYTVEVFGDNMGQLMAAFYASCRESISYAYRHRIFNMDKINNTLLRVFEYVKNKKVNYDELKSIMYPTDAEWIFKNEKYLRRERMDKNFGFYLSTILEKDLSDSRYLFRLDKYISDIEVGTAKFLSNYPKEKIETLSKTTVDAFIRGFVVDNKNRGNRNSVQIVYTAGQEIIIRQLIKDFEKAGFESTIAIVDSSEANKQYNYDHRFDNAIYLNEEYIQIKESMMEKAFEFNKDIFSVQAGPMVFESFGEVPFSPENKKECLKLSKEQQDLMQKHKNKVNQLFDKFEPEENTSFSIIAFPTAEIGDKFEEIFNDVFQINMMDNNIYEGIQQKIIDALDEGEYVHVKGKGNNKTDIKVKLQKLKDKSKETNFVNCVADVNIPLGEVFTSPQLKGTNGVLHLEDTYLDLKYKDLKLTFKDGYVSDYTCGNFENEEDNRAYVKENLLQLNDTLPLGEFAIGTNTEAYVMAEKYDIIEKLPVLIIEKMGPHFAIGDTCFGYAEDLPVYNMLDKKEIIARDNEKSILRKEDINKAYTNVHTDITLPYEGIEFISVVTEKGEYIDIIRDGRFVLKGTEKLNEPF